MVSWSIATVDDRLRAVAEQVGDFQKELGLQARYGPTDVEYVLGLIESGRITAVWISDHTLLLYTVSQGTWCAPRYRILNELLLFKYNHSRQMTLPDVVAVLRALGAAHECDAVAIDNSLHVAPERMSRIWRRYGFYPATTTHVKEIPHGLSE